MQCHYLIAADLLKRNTSVHSEFTLKCTEVLPLVHSTKNISILSVWNIVCTARLPVIYMNAHFTQTVGTTSVKLQLAADLRMHPILLQTPKFHCSFKWIRI